MGLFDYVRELLGESDRFTAMHRRAQKAESEAAQAAHEANVLQYRLAGALEALKKARGERNALEANNKVLMEALYRMEVLHGRR